MYKNDFIVRVFLSPTRRRTGAVESHYVLQNRRRTMPVDDMWPMHGYRKLVYFRRWKAMFQCPPCLLCLGYSKWSGILLRLNIPTIVYGHRTSRTLGCVVTHPMPILVYKVAVSQCPSTIKTVYTCNNKVFLFMYVSRIPEYVEIVLCVRKSLNK